MTTELPFLIEEASEGGWTARALGESIFTDADTLEDLRLNIKEAVVCHFDGDMDHHPDHLSLYLRIPHVLH